MQLDVKVIELSWLGFCILQRFINDFLELSLKIVIWQERAEWRDLEHLQFCWTKPPSSLGETLTKFGFHFLLQHFRIKPGKKVIFELFLYVQSFPREKAEKLKNIINLNEAILSC